MPDQSTESSSHVKKQHYHVTADHPEPAEWPEDRIYNPGDLSQLINETSDLDRWRDQVQERS